MGVDRAPVILDRYVLHDEIASGGMASVHFGQVLGAGGFARTVAIKRLHPQFAKDPEFVTMFLDEARLAARVHHPNVVSTLDIVSTGDELFLVMEYVAGESLSSIFRAAKHSGMRMPPPVASSIVSGTLLGLHAAHEALSEDGVPLQIVHRDVSPHNILVGQDGAARVLDFGVARAEVRSGVTRDGQVKGKIRYMAPEQLRGSTATRRSDLYAAAVVLWEALTGERLFDGDSDAVVYGRVLEGVVPPPSSLAAVGPAADAVVLRGLRRDPEGRCATALQMAESLEAAIPPALPREVSAWLDAAAGPVLSRRARRVQEIEGRRSLASIPPLSPSIADPVTETGTLPEAQAREIGSGLISVTDAQPSRSPAKRGDPADRPTSTLTLTEGTRIRRGRWRAAAAASGAALIGGALAVAVAALGGRAGAVATARRGLASAALLASLKERSATAAIAAAPAPSADTEANAAPPDTAANAGSTAAAAAAQRKLPAKAPARSACDPPYYVDDTGIRRVKRECIR
jgi:eukaryotic-like serine/threonine-protein kinase